MAFQLSLVAEDFVRRAKSEFNITEEKALAYMFKYGKETKTVDDMLEVIRKDLAGAHEEDK